MKNSTEAGSTWRPTPVTLIAGGLVAGGIALTGINWWFLLLTAAGTFGPGILRELGWLRDKDEFQRLAAYRAGYHAYVVTGIIAFLLVAFFRSGDRTIASPQELVTLILIILWFTWMLSSLIAYWGVSTAASRILIGFGLAWLLFAIISNVGSEWTGWTALLLHPLLAVPFFGLAWISKHKPRVAGVMLLAASAFFVQFFGLFRHDNLALINQAVTFVLFVGPLLATGIALLVGSVEVDEIQTKTEDSATRS